MAEFVEFRAEEWLPELEQMERIRLFEPKEIKSLATKRKEFEYKIQRRTKCKEDFLKYIQFEVDLLRIIKARRKKSRIKTKRAEIDHSQSQRIASLFKQVIFRFPNDIKLWMSFFQYCEGVKFYSLVSQMLVRMLQIHTNKVDLWIFAAKWEFEKCKSINNARQFLTRGLRHHPSCDVLYKELFKLELEHIRLKKREVENKRKEDENWMPDGVTNSILNGKVAEVIYESAIKDIQGVELKVCLLDISKEKQAPKNLINKIFQDIVKNHINEELTWDTIAKREFEGFQCDIKELLGGESQMEIDKNTEKSTLRDRIQRSINVFEESVEKLKSIKMWSFYLDFVLKLNEDVNSLPVFKAKLLRNAMEGAMTSGNLTEKYYHEWVERLQKSGDRNKLSQVLKTATEHHPNSLQLWHARLRFHLAHDEEEKGMEVFSEAIKRLTDAAPLWILMVKYLSLKSSPKLEGIFQNGVQQGGETSEVLKPLYLEWLAQTKGIEEARKTFQSPEMNLHPCLELYQKMASLESAQDEPCLENVRKCHELTCKNFGRSNPRVWLDYIQFELKGGELARVTQIHRRALKALNPVAADDFVSEFNNFKIKTSEGQNRDGAELRIHPGWVRSINGNYKSVRSYSDNSKAELPTFF